MVADLRRLLRVTTGKKAEPSAALLDGRTLHSTPERGSRAGWDGHKRAQVAQLTAQLQQVTGEAVQVAFVDQGYTGIVIKLPQAKRGFVLLPKRWVVERSFAWAARFRR